MNIQIKKNTFKKKNKIYINWRFFTLFSIIFSFLIILTLRIIFIQVFNSKKLTYEGDRRTLRTELITNTRGIITDRLGYPLATTVLVNSVFIDPSIITDTKNIINNIRWKALSKILSTSLNKIIFNIHKHQKKNFFI